MPHKKEISGTYDLDKTENFDFIDLQKQFAVKGVERILWKPLSPNDNSKNQPYFGGDFSALNVIPSGQLEVTKTSSAKPSTSAGKELIKSALNFSWLDPEGTEYLAPNAKLILYPQYPEVRFSGFLQNSKVAMSKWMQPNKFGRSADRHLILGITDSGVVYGYLAVPGSAIANYLGSVKRDSITSVFFELPLLPDRIDSKTILLNTLSEIHLSGWHKSQRLTRDSNGSINISEYSAANGGGYTLEALLGIFPNGDSAPDFHGWEVKQYSVSSCQKSENISKAITLMTPEPDGGLYKTEGVAAFVNEFGYPDRLGRPNRYNFGGTHYVDKNNKSTDMSLALAGFHKNLKSFDVNGSVDLMHGDRVAASWSYVKLLEHWRKKHSQAVYVPCVATNTQPKEYYYCSPVYLGEGTDFAMYLKSLKSGSIYYDPGIKLEVGENGKSKTKRRSQFRIRFKDVNRLYEKWTKAELD